MQKTNKWHFTESLNLDIFEWNKLRLEFATQVCGDSPKLSSNGLANYHD